MGNLEEELRKVERLTVSGQFRLLKDNWNNFMFQLVIVMCNPVFIVLTLVWFAVGYFWGIDFITQHLNNLRGE